LEELDVRLLLPAFIVKKIIPVFPAAALMLGIAFAQTGTGSHGKKSGSAQTAPTSGGTTQPNQGDIPPFHNSPPAQGAALPPVLTQGQLADQGRTLPSQVAAYKAAAAIPGVIYQLPCYSHCDRDHGHTSLHSCFETLYGANCGTCIAEALYAYQKSKIGLEREDDSRWHRPRRMEDDRFLASLAP
jgi:hypothetical protein